MNILTEADDTLLASCLCFFQLPAENNVVNQVDTDAESGRQRCREAEPVDKSTKEHERYLRQKLLQGERRADADDPQGFPVKADVFARHIKRQIFPAHDIS